MNPRTNSTYRKNRKMNLDKGDCVFTQFCARKTPILRTEKQKKSQAKNCENLRNKNNNSQKRGESTQKQKKSTRRNMVECQKRRPPRDMGDKGHPRDAPVASGSHGGPSCVWRSERRRVWLAPSRLVLALTRACACAYVHVRATRLAVLRGRLSALRCGRVVGRPCVVVTA